MTVNKKDLMFCMPEVLLAEGFKSCKTLKQENTPQETSKDSHKNMKEIHSTKFPWAIPKQYWSKNEKNGEIEKE